jgi:DNA-binding MarR family transcriptional regulator
MKKMKDWCFITNHGLILLHLSQHPRCTTHELASAINATERTVHRVLIDLEGEGYIARHRAGRCNMYQINSRRHLKHELTRDSAVGDLLNLLGHKRRQKQQKGNELAALTSDAVAE